MQTMGTWTFFSLCCTVRIDCLVWRNHWIHRFLRQSGHVNTGEHGCHSSHRSIVCLVGMKPRCCFPFEIAVAIVCHETLVWTDYNPDAYSWNSTWHMTRQILIAVREAQSDQLPGKVGAQGYDFAPIAELDPVVHASSNGRSREFVLRDNWKEQFFVIPPQFYVFGIGPYPASATYSSCCVLWICCIPIACRIEPMHIEISFQSMAMLDGRLCSFDSFGVYIVEIGNRCFRIRGIIRKMVKSFLEREHRHES